MQRVILGVILSVAVLAVAAGSAPACLWDTEVIGHEKEFKSSYLEQPDESSSTGQPVPYARSDIGLLMTGGGLIMLVGGLFVGMVRGLAPQRPQDGRAPSRGDGP